MLGHCAVLGCRLNEQQVPAFEEWDEQKLRFALDSLFDVDPFATQTEVHEDVAEVRSLRTHSGACCFAVVECRLCVGMQRRLHRKSYASVKK